MQDFKQRFQKGGIPEDIPDVEMGAVKGPIPLANVLKEAGLCQSTSDAMRMVRQGAVRIDGERVEDPKLVINPGVGIYQVGKRKFARITVV